MRLSTAFPGWAACAAVLCLGGALGCQPQAAVAPPAAAEAQPAASDAAPSTAGSAADSSADDAPAASPSKRRPVQLGGGASAAASAAGAERDPESVMAALKPLQVLLGRWNGTSRKAQVDQPEWVWDLRSDPEHPALVMKSEKGAYIREARLTYLPDSRQFQFSYKTPEGAEHLLRGDFKEPVHDVPGDDKKLQRTFKLQFVEGAAAGGEQWQLALHQQENNRYILELDRRRGTGAFQRVDTVHTQREGTSFAVSDTDYGEKTCIISQGLGTIAVSYKGQSYWVCCTGCKAAFEEDPERWIAKFEARKKMNP